MGRVATILLAAALAACLATGSTGSTGSTGRTSAVVSLPVHGTLILAGSSIRCGSGLLKSLVYIDCGVSDAKGEPKQGSYVVLMATDGRVNVVSATTLKTVFSRAPAAVHAAPAGTAVHPGDTIVLPSVSSISCTASKVGGKPTIICYYVDKVGVVRPGSYSFGISDAVATSLGWDAGRHAHLISSWPENG